MFSEQRSAFDELLIKKRSGRMTRRTFLERAVAIGLSSAAAIPLLESCDGVGTRPGGSTIHLVWQSRLYSGW